jgi:hypothetical protein
MVMQLSKGLVFLSRLADASEWEVKADLLRRELSRPSPVWASLTLGLELEAKQIEPRTTLEEYTQEERDALQGVVAETSEDESGPFTVWARENSSAFTDMFVYRGGNEELREAAWVMWDLSTFRTSDLNAQLKHQDWIWSELDEYTTEEIERWEESHEPRAAIYGKGGSGYWAPGDESRIMWKTPWFESPRTEKRPEELAVDQRSCFARRFLFTDHWPKDSPYPTL